MKLAKFATFVSLFVLAASFAFALIIPPDPFTLYPRCVNASSGDLLGSSANLTVYNETGVYYESANVVNTAPGMFEINITNLTIGHCYSLDFSCKDAGTWTRQWSTVCVNQSATAAVKALEGQGGSVAGVLGAVGAAAFFVMLALLYRNSFPQIVYLVIPFVLLCLILAANIALQASSAGGVAGAIGGSQTLLKALIVLLVVCVSGEVIYFAFYFLRGLAKEVKIR